MAGLTALEFLEEAITCLRRGELALAGPAITGALLTEDPPPREISERLEAALLREDYVRAADVLERDLLPLFTKGASST